MKIFRKKKKEIKSCKVVISDEPYEGNSLLQRLALKKLQSVNPDEILINYRGNLIKPAHTKIVYDNAIAEMKRNGYPNDVKDACVHFTNAYVWFSLKEGARLQGIAFNDSTIDLFFYIDLADYHKIILAAHNSGIFNFVYN